MDTVTYLREFAERVALYETLTAQEQEHIDNLVLAPRAEFIRYFLVELLPFAKRHFQKLYAEVAEQADLTQVEILVDYVSQADTLDLGSFEFYLWRLKIGAPCVIEFEEQAIAGYHMLPAGEDEEDYYKVPLDLLNNFTCKYGKNGCEWYDIYVPGSFSAFSVDSLEFFSAFLQLFNYSRADALAFFGKYHFDAELINGAFFHEFDTVENSNALRLFDFSEELIGLLSKETPLN